MMTQETLREAVADGRCPNCAEDEMDGGRCYYCGYHEYSCDSPDCRWCNDLPKQDKETMQEAVAAIAKDRADWLLDAVATATQDRRFLRGEPEYDEWAGEALLLNGEKAIRIACEKAIATMFERLRNLPPSIYDGPDQYVRKADVLAAFQQENSDAD